MISQAKNKNIEKAPVDKQQDYFYSGGTIYKPVNIRASSQEEADQLWEKQREAVIISNKK